MGSACGLLRSGRPLVGASPLCAGGGWCAVRGELRLERFDELAEQLLGNLLQHAAAELGELADHLQIGVDGDAGVITARRAVGR